MTPLTSAFWVVGQVCLIGFFIIRKEHYKSLYKSSEADRLELRDEYAAEIVKLRHQLNLVQRRDASRQMFLNYVNRPCVPRVPTDEDLERGWWR